MEEDHISFEIIMSLKGETRNRCLSCCEKNISQLCLITIDLQRNYLNRPWEIVVLLPQPTLEGNTGPLYRRSLQ